MTRESSFQGFFRESRPLFYVLAVVWALAVICFLVTLSLDHSTQREVLRATTRLEQIYRSPQSSQADLQEAVAGALQSRAHASITREVFSHLAIALFVGGMLILTVDLVMRYLTRREYRRYADDIASNVWSAIFERLVPPPIPLCQYE
jgi:hypothetical protein